MTTKRPLLRRALLALVASLTLVVGMTGSVSPARAIDKPAKPDASAKSMAMQVKWTAVDGAKSYNVRYSTSKNFTSSTTDTVSGLTSTTLYVNRGLTSGKTYYVQVQAVDSSGGTSSWSSSDTAKPKTTSAKVTNLSIDNKANTEVELSWRNVDKSSGCYIIGLQRQVDGKDVEQITGFTGSENAICGTNATLSGLKKNTSYRVYMFVAEVAGSVGTGWPYVIRSKGSSSLKFTTSNYDVNAPTNLKVSKQSSDGFKLSWTAPNDLPSGASYKVLLGPDMLISKTQKSVTSKDNSYEFGTNDDNALSSNTMYYVRVLVLDADGKQISARSDYTNGKTITSRSIQLSGTISGPAMNNVVVMAYDDDGEVADYALPNSSGAFSFDLRGGDSNVPYTLWVECVNGPYQSKSAGSFSADTSGINVTLSK